jgi:hypothetical protein
VTATSDRCDALRACDVEAVALLEQLLHGIHQPILPEAVKALPRRNVAQHQSCLDDHLVLGFLPFTKPNDAVGAVGTGTVVGGVAIALVGPRVEIDAADDPPALKLPGLLVLRNARS